MSRRRFNLKNADNYYIEATTREELVKVRRKSTLFKHCRIKFSWQGWADVIHLGVIYPPHVTSREDFIDFNESFESFEEQEEKYEKRQRALDRI